ncbi:MAG: type 1 glutamine amidotransferase domain-containing protein [Pseudomonadota bacterium]|nr:type 1 glutamine amidotransferase domain-containing protein [Pseudomonadota bacterium]
MNVLFAVTSADTLAPGHPTGLWLEEFAVPYIALAEVGVDITVASPKGGAAPVDPKTAPDDKAREEWGPAIAALANTARLADLTEANLDALYIPGGHGPMVDLRHDGDLARLIGAFDRAGKIVAAICHGPAALLGATNAEGQPFVKGRRITGFTNGEETLAGLQKVVPFCLETELRGAGGLFEHALLPAACHIVTDRNLITGQNPASSLAMAKALVDGLAERQRARMGGAAA